jgi:hypothetical protein
MVISGKRFSEEIGEVVCREDLFKSNGTGIYELPNIMVSDVDVLNFAMVLRILG